MQNQAVPIDFSSETQHFAALNPQGRNWEEGEKQRYLEWLINNPPIKRSKATEVLGDITTVVSGSFSVYVQYGFEAWVNEKKRRKAVSDMRKDYKKSLRNRQGPSEEITGLTDKISSLTNEVGALKNEILGMKKVI